MNSAGLWEPFVYSLPMLIVGGIAFFKLRKAKNVNLLRIYLLVFALQFAVMPLYAFPIEWFSGRWPYTSEQLWSAYLNLHLFLAGVLLLLFIFDLSAKRFRRGWTIPMLLEQQYRSISLPKAAWYFAIVIGFLLGYNIYFGYTYYASGTLERNLSVPYPMVVLKSFAQIFVFGLIGCGALHLIRGKKYLPLGVLFLASNIMLDFYGRRHYLAAIIILVLFKLLLDRFQVRLRQIIIVGAVGLFVTQVFFPFLFVFRLVTHESAEAGRTETDFSKTYEVSQGSRGHLLGKGLEENVTYRTNAIARNIEIMNLPGPEGRHMNGLLVASQAAMVVPRALNPAKIDLGGRALSPEVFIFLFYGRKGFDLSDNLPLYGFLEFGYLGGFLVGVLQGLLLIVFEWFAFRFQRIHPFLGLSVFMFALYSHLNLEYPYSQEFSLLREMLLLFLLVWPLSFLLRIFSKNMVRRNLSSASG